MIFVPKYATWQDELPLLLGEVVRQKVEKKEEKEDPAPIKQIFSALFNDKWWTWLGFYPSSHAIAISEVIFKFEERKWTQVSPIPEPGDPEEGLKNPPDMSEQTLITESDFDDILMEFFRRQCNVKNESPVARHELLMTGELGVLYRGIISSKDNQTRPKDVVKKGWLVFDKDWGYIERAKLPMLAWQEAKIVCEVKFYSDDTYTICPLKDRIGKGFTYSKDQPLALELRGGYLNATRRSTDLNYDELEQLKFRNVQSRGCYISTSYSYNLSTFWPRLGDGGTVLPMLWKQPCPDDEDDDEYNGRDEKTAKGVAKKAATAKTGELDD